MYDPKTIQEAKARKYGAWAGNPAGMPYNEKHCAYEVFNLIGRQCSRGKGHGPDRLYCKQHAKIVMPQSG